MDCREFREITCDVALEFEQQIRLRLYAHYAGCLPCQEWVAENNRPEECTEEDKREVDAIVAADQEFLRSRGRLR